MKNQSLAFKMLLGRFLTRSGDQAWDFAVPLVILKVMPGELRFAALYYLLVRLVHVIVLPRLATLIDQINRFQAAKIGITLQLIGVGLGVTSVPLLSKAEFSIPIFGVLIWGGILSGLGSSFMDIAIANDLVPSSFDTEELPGFNSKLRQVDLLTEVTAPVLAGLLLLIAKPELPLLGFYLVALWNLVSFFPEYILLRSIFRSRPDLERKQIVASLNIREPIYKKLLNGWSAFFREPVAMVVGAYALLWLSVLSPHGVLLTAFLKDGWELPEWAIGTFRGMGALFGLMATVLFPKVIKYFGLARGSQAFILFQTLTVGLALSCFLIGGLPGQIGFLGFILLSRIGLYGFSLGEMQIRQIGIRAESRGKVNGFASALTGVATLGLYSLGALLPTTADFEILILLSVAIVAVAALIFTVWTSKERKNRLYCND